MPDVGEIAPDFELPDGSGQTCRLSDLRGRPVVLYFYPKDQTPGCTQEARDFRELHVEFLAADAAVLGVSPDGIASHRRFAEKQSLPFRLLADTDHAVAEAYGVWKEKSLYGRAFMGIERTTFLIGRDGRVVRVWPKVRVKGHAADELEAVRSL